MQKLRIVSLDRDKESVIAALHMMGAIDLRKSKLELEDDKPAPYSNDISESLIRVNGALQLLPAHEIEKAERHIMPKSLVSEVKKLEIINQIYSLGNERKEIEDDQRSIAYAQHIATAFLDIKIDFSKIKSDYLVYRAFETDGKGAKVFARNVKKSGIKDIELYTSRTGKGFLVLAVYGKSENIDEFFKGLKINELDLAAKYLDSTPVDILNTTKSRSVQNNVRFNDIQKRLASISSKNYSHLSNLKEMLEIELERADVSSAFKKTQSTFVVEGWVWKKRVEELKQRVSNITNAKAYIEELESDELAPTYTRRPGFLKPFDYLVSFYSVQRSDEIDPTWIFIISFPIFYGLMVTDVGYGIASLLLATFIASRSKNDQDGLLYNAAKLWQLNSFAAMFFGLLSNQYFGFQLPYSTPFHFDWLKNTPELIAITIIFGIIQVLLGLALGIYNSYHHGHKKLAIAKFTSMLVVFFGTLAVAGLLFGAISTQIATISEYIAILAVIPTLALSGIEAAEITSLITHPLSYARLMGFGLGSVIIAFLIDMAFTPNLSNGIVTFIIFAIIFVLLHLLNMTLSIFEGLVQGVRLNFVEFFSKFYIGSGISFSPFSYKRVYTKENE